jgi:hypothetical protein
LVSHARISYLGNANGIFVDKLTIGDFMNEVNGVGPFLLGLIIGFMGMVITEPRGVWQIVATIIISAIIAGTLGFFIF